MHVDARFQVRLGIHTFSGLMVAVKMIDKSKLVEANDRRRVGRELRVLKRLTCSGVIKLYEVRRGYVLGLCLWSSLQVGVRDLHETIFTTGEQGDHFGNWNERVLIEHDPPA